MLSVLLTALDSLKRHRHIFIVRPPLNLSPNPTLIYDLCI